MSALPRIIQQTPIRDYQLVTHLEDYRRDRRLTKAELEDLLQAGLVWFAVADVGHELQLVEPSHSRKFWQAEVRPHLADKPDCRLEDFPDEYFYRASHWRAEGARPIVLLEKEH